MHLIARGEKRRDGLFYARWSYAGEVRRVVKITVNSPAVSFLFREAPIRLTTARLVFSATIVILTAGYGRGVRRANIAAPLEHPPVFEVLDGQRSAVLVLPIA